MSKSWRTNGRTVGIVTALNPVLGYDKSTELAGKAYKSGKGILEGDPRGESAHGSANQRLARSG
jgi:fumarate hydratase class II